MINIIYLVSELYPSGPINQALNIVTSFNPNKVKAIVVTLFDERPQSWMDKYLSNNVEVIQLHTSRKKLFRARLKLLKIIREKNIHIVHSSGFSADLVNSMLSRYVCTVTTFRSHISDLSERANFAVRIVSRTLFRYSLGKIDVRVGCSKALSKDMEADTGKTCKVVQNGADIDHFKNVSNSEKLALRRKLSLPRDKKIFISVGALEPRKNMKLIVEAFNSLDKDDKMLIIVGEGEERAQIEAIKAKNVRLVGQVNDTAEYYQASDILISSSLAEGLPNTVLEAMSCGLPCILSDIGPHYEMLEYDNEAGVIFNRFDSTQLSSVIKDSLSWDLQKKGNTARRMIVNNLSKYCMAENYYNIYKNALQNKNK